VSETTESLYESQRQLTTKFFLKNKSFAILAFTFFSALATSFISQDTSWYRENLYVYFGLLTFFFAVVSNTSLGASAANTLTRFADFLRRRGAFKSNPETEAPKFGLIRIVFGVFLFQRAFWIVSYLQPSDWQHPAIWIAAIANLTCASLVLVGFFNQVALVFLIVIQWQIGDTILKTTALGNDISALLATLLLFANAGAHHSVDGWVMERRGLLGRMMSSVYFRNGLPSEATLQNVKFLTLAGYWCICLFSMAMHLGDPAWMAGVAGPQLLSNNFMSRFSTEFAWFFTLGSIPVTLGKLALWAMIPWYILLLPGIIIGGWLRAYAIIWAILFFILSITVLQVGTLAHFEFLFFAALFWNKPFLAGPKTILVAYDDACNLCDRAVSFVKAVDIFRRVELRPLSKSRAWLLSMKIDPEDAQKDLYAVQTDRNNLVVKGYEFYTVLSSRLLLLLPLYPVLIAGRYLGGPAVYRFIADRRTKVFGVCHIPTHKADHLVLPSGETTPSSIDGSDPIVPTFLHFMVLAISFIVTIPMPNIWITAPAFVGRIREALTLPSRAALIYGMTRIDVFNQMDLRMAENWFTISVKGPDGSEVLLPIFSPDGKRLSVHRSDRMYFGNTLRFRRAVIGSAGCVFDAYRPMFEYLVESTHAPPGTLIYRQYREPLPRFDLLQKGQYVPGIRALICETTY
jgi:predicted DCC family thiol-disulfide oxidoreductase YuxK